MSANCNLQVLQMEGKCSPDEDFIEELMHLTSDFEEVKTRCYLENPDDPFSDLKNMTESCLVNTLARGRRIYQPISDSTFSESHSSFGGDLSPKRTPKAARGRGRTYLHGPTKDEDKEDGQPVVGGSRYVVVPPSARNYNSSMNEQFENHQPSPNPAPDAFSSDRWFDRSTLVGATAHISAEVPSNRYDSDGGAKCRSGLPQADFRLKNSDSEVYESSDEEEVDPMSYSRGPRPPTDCGGARPKTVVKPREPSPRKAREPVVTSKLLVRPEYERSKLERDMYGNVFEGPSTWTTESDFPSLSAGSGAKAKSKNRNVFEGNSTWTTEADFPSLSAGSGAKAKSKNRNVLEGNSTWTTESDFHSLSAGSGAKAKSKKKESHSASSVSAKFPWESPVKQDVRQSSFTEPESVGACAALLITLLVENLPTSITKGSMLDFLEPFGNIVSIDLIKAGTKFNAYVKVDSEETCEYIISCLDGGPVPLEGSDEDDILTVTKLL